MKFVERVCSIGRTGMLSDLPAPWQNETFKTPMFLTYTRCGSVPHLTFDSLNRLDCQQMIMVQTMPTVVEFKDAVAAQDRGLSCFVGLPEYPFYVSMQDPATPTPTGYNVKKGVSVWTNAGKKILSTREFMSTIKVFRPIFYQALCDSDTPKDCSKKRMNKAVDYSLTFLDECLKEHVESNELKTSAVFGTIQGGYDSFLRKKSAQQTALRAVDGFIIDGFHLNGPEVRNISFCKIEPLLKETLSCLPSNKPRILHGALRPDMILEAIRSGIDIFDSSYAYILTEAGEALIYSPSSVHIKSQLEENTAKHPKLAFEICLHDNLHADDFSPILKGCSCYTCKNFTRAYVHHLLVTSELLAYILLMIHNMHHFSDFFHRIRTTLENDNLR